MATTKKEESKKVSDKTAQPAKSEKEVSKPHPAAKTAEGIFAQIQAKTGLDNKKIDEWQKKWISLPEKRTKYEHLKDAPDVVGEEVYAIANDIIDFIQREEGGKSVIFKNIKEGVGSFIHNPGGYLKEKAAQLKGMVEKTKNKTNEVKNSAQAKASQVKEVAEKTAKTATKETSAPDKNKKNKK